MGFCMLPAVAIAQTVETMLMFDARSGYTGNSFLNPFFPVWDNTVDDGFFTVTPMAQLSLSGRQTSASVTGGVSYQDFYSGGSSTTGYFFAADGNWRMNRWFSLGLEAGTSRMRAVTDRDQYWVQPVVRLRSGLFTQWELKAGVSDRSIYNDFAEPVNSSVTFYSYSVGLETWPSFNWRFRSALSGDIEDPTSTFGVRAGADVWPRQSLQLTVESSFERFRFDFSQDQGQNPGEEGPNTPTPFMSSAMAMANVGTPIASGNIVRGGIEAAYSATELITLFSKLEGLRFSDSTVENSTTSAQISAGFRFVIRPRVSRGGGATVQMQKTNGQAITMHLAYSGPGTLYITGEFNQWETPGVPLVRVSGNRYAVQLDLPPGGYEYKILLLEGESERWIPLSDDTYTVPDGFGGENGLLFID